MKIARARAIRGTVLYNVTYPGAVDLDRSVPHSYLTRLADDGFTVHVSGSGPTYTIYPPAKGQGADATGSRPNGP